MKDFFSVREVSWVVPVYTTNMAEYEVSLTRIFSYRDRIFDFIFIREYKGQRNPYSGVFNAVPIILGIYRFS